MPSILAYTMILSVVDGGIAVGRPVHAYVPYNALKSISYTILSRSRTLSFSGITFSAKISSISSCKSLLFSEEFFIEPKFDYPELFHKRIDLQYQHEMRIFILNAPAGVKSVVIPFEPISVDSGNFALGQLYLEGTATFKKKE